MDLYTVTLRLSLDSHYSYADTVYGLVIEKDLFKAREEIYKFTTHISKLAEQGEIDIGEEVKTGKYRSVSEEEWKATENSYENDCSFYYQRYGEGDERYSFLLLGTSSGISFEIMKWNLS